MTRPRPTAFLDVRECDRIINETRPLLREVIPLAPVRSSGTGFGQPDEVSDPVDVAGIVGPVESWLCRLVDPENPPPELRMGIRRYRSGHGMAAHFDKFPALATTHTSIVVQLSDPADYRGGWLQLRDVTWQPPVTKARGAVLIFDGSRIRHRVRPVTEGERWCIHAWTYFDHNARENRQTATTTSHRFDEAVLPHDVGEVLRAWLCDSHEAKYDTRRDIGGCLNASRALAVLAQRAGLRFEILRYNAMSHWRTSVQHIVDVGNGIVIDSTARQWLAGATGPLVTTRAAYEEVFGDPLPCCPGCGTTGDLDSEFRRLPLSEHQCPGPEASF